MCCIMLRHCNATAKDLESVAEPEPVGAGLFLSEAEPIFKIKGCSGSAQKMFLKNRTLCFSLSKQNSF